MEAPEYFQANFYPQFNQEKRIMDTKQNDPFAVEEFLDFSNEEDNNNNNNNAAIIGCGDATTTTFNDTINTGGTSTESSTVTVVDSCNSSFSAGCDNPHLLAGDHYDHHRNLADGNNFSNDLCVPYDDLAELEWLSNFVEESFSSEDLQKLQLISGMKARPDETSSETNEFLPEPNKTNTIFRPEMPVPGKARSKRSRAAPCNWTSRLLVVSPTTSSSDTELQPIASLGKKTVKSALKKKDGSDLDDGSGSRSGDGRKCLHCATDKTPQWRTGPMGPKTLCNACGVRYKSGRLVPEYRPAASPTFVLTKHSNSHRKVLELRRQKEMQRPHQHQQHQQFIHHHQNMMFDVSKGDDYLIHQHVGPDFRQLI